MKVRTGEEIRSLLDVLPATFQGLPESLDAATKTEIADRMNGAISQRE
ncbi:hypothetical protein ACH492_06000 [Streptomyces sp. NPDC019443]